jgi:2-dehydropantoate 2-reductase
VQEVNGWVVDMLRKHGRDAPMNQRVVELGFEIEKGTREAHPDNSKLMIETYKKHADHL